MRAANRGIVSRQFPPIMKHGEGFKPNSTFRGADLPFDRLEDWEMERRPVFLGIGNSPQNRYKNLLFYLHHFSVGDYLSGWESWSSLSAIFTEFQHIYFRKFQNGLRLA